jgi:hypothetical protein
MSVTIGRSSGYFRLDEAARAALQHCKFQPGTLDGKPTRAPATIEYVWTLSRNGPGTIVATTQSSCGRSCPGNSASLNPNLVMSRIRIG